MRFSAPKQFLGLRNAQWFWPWVLFILVRVRAQAEDIPVLWAWLWACFANSHTTSHCLTVLSGYSSESDCFDSVQRLIFKCSIQHAFSKQLGFVPSDGFFLCCWNIEGMLSAVFFPIMLLVSNGIMSASVLIGMRVCTRICFPNHSLFQLGICHSPDYNDIIIMTLPTPTILFSRL